jgi:hypothetical protein
LQTAITTGSEGVCNAQMLFEPVVIAVCNDQMPFGAAGTGV